MAAIEHLRRLRLIDPADIVAEGIVVRDASRRHHLNLVEGPSRVAVKLPGSEGPAHALERERRALEWLADGHDGLGPLMLAWDPTSQLLVTELLDGETLDDHASRLGFDFPQTAARLGARLGALHAASAHSDFAADVPSIFRLHRPSPAALGHRTRGQLELVRMVQRAPAACAALDDARRDWRATAFIHGDVRWHNVIVTAPRGAGDGAVRLVDWESAGRGDPCWDVGSCVAAATLDWLSAAAGFASDPAAAADLALAQARPTVGALWRAWADRVGLTSRTAVEARERAARLAGARLVQFAHEIAGETDRLEPTAALAALVGVDVLARSREAVEILFEASDPASLPSR